MQKKEPMSIFMVVATLLLIIWSALYKPAPCPTPMVEPVLQIDTLAVEPVDEWVISPYDSLVQACSDSAGLDWRLVSAVIFHESGFDNEVVSSRGAGGLMQIMPKTALRMGMEDASDPEENVRAGTLYMKYLLDHYDRHAPDSTERFKFMLAAYNAGLGRISDCIRYTRFRGQNASVWENVAGLIPEMSKDTAFMNSGVARFGDFDGTETVSFVRKVSHKYAEYQRSSTR